MPRPAFGFEYQMGRSVANSTIGRERARSLVVTIAPVAPQVLGLTPRGSEFLRI
jgi:hypothetical protein